MKKRVSHKSDKRQALLEEFAELQKYGAEQARRKGVFTEEDVDRIVSEERKKDA